MVNLMSLKFRETGGTGIHKEGFLGIQAKHNWAKQAIVRGSLASVGYRGRIRADVLDLLDLELYRINQGVAMPPFGLIANGNAI